MNCERCGTTMQELIPSCEGSNEQATAMASVQWCPSCGSAFHAVQDDEGGESFGWRHPNPPQRSSRLFRRWRGSFVINFPKGDPKAALAVESFAECNGSCEQLNRLFQDALKQGYCSRGIADGVYELFPAQKGWPNERQT